MNTFNEKLIMAGRSDDCVNELKELLRLSETTNDGKLLNSIVHASNVQVILKLRKSRWMKVRRLIFDETIT